MNCVDESKKNITTVKELKKQLKIDLKTEKVLRKIIEKHPMSITPYYASLIDWNDKNDPLRRLVVPRMCGLRVFRPLPSPLNLRLRPVFMIISYLA